MDTKEKGFIFLVYLCFQLGFIFIFFKFPLDPFPAEVIENVSGEQVVHNTHITLQHFIKPSSIVTDGNIEKVTFTLLGWIMAILILFLTPVLITFRVYKRFYGER